MNTALHFVQAHWVACFTAWVTINALLSPLATKVPATTWYGKGLHAFVALSPADVVKALKALGVKLPAALAGLACLVFLAAAGCGSLTAQDRLETGTFEGQQDACIAATPHDPAAIDACRAGVHAQWCATWAKRFDAAVCAPADAGGDR